MTGQVHMQTHTNPLSGIEMPDPTLSNQAPPIPSFSAPTFLRSDGEELQIYTFFPATKGNVQKGVQHHLGARGHKLGAISDGGEMYHNSIKLAASKEKTMGQK